MLLDLHKGLTLTVHFLGIFPSEIYAKLLRGFSLAVKLKVWEYSSWHLIITEVALLVIVDLSDTLLEFLLCFVLCAQLLGVDIAAFGEQVCL